MFNKTIWKFNTEANIIQAKYGYKIIAEYLENLFADIIVNAPAMSRNKISNNPYTGDFSPKNKNDHNALSVNWVPNIIKNCFLYFCFDDVSFL